MIYEVIYLSTEIDVLDLRLHDYDGIIDKHIIVEYPTDYSGRKRKMYYDSDKERFKKFEDKIIHIIDDDVYGGAMSMALAANRKKSKKLMDAVSFCKDDDFLLICDGDAYVKKQVLENFDQTKHTIFRMEWCQYWMNAYCTHVAFDWCFGAPLSKFRAVGNFWDTIYSQSDTMISDSGWHWTKLGGVEKIIENIMGYPHQEYSYNPALVDPVLIQERIDNMWGWDDFSRGKNVGWNYVYRKFDPEYYPKYISERWDIFSKYFKEVE